MSMSRQLHSHQQHRVRPSPLPLHCTSTYFFLYLHVSHVYTVYDDKGEIIGELGISTPGVTMALSLPLYACWAYILLTAAKLQHWQTAKRAAGVLLPRFIATSASRPLWQAHPMDRHQLQLQQVQDAAGPLLRLLVQAVYVYAYHHGQQHQLAVASGAGVQETRAVQEAAGTPTVSGLAGTAASRALLLGLSESQVPGQVAVLELTKYLLMAMQVSASAQQQGNSVWCPLHCT